MKTVLASIAVLFMLAVFSSNVAQAQERDTCIIINGVKCRVDLDASGNPIDTICDEGSSGSGAFTTRNGPIPPQGPIKATLTPDAIVASVVDPTLGVITTTLDNTQPVPATTISSTTKDRFPLAVRISFPAEAQISSQPCAVYKSRKPLVFSNTRVNTFPFNNETLTLANDVEFYDQSNPEVTSFVLQGGSTTVTLGQR